MSKIKVLPKIVMVNRPIEALGLTMKTSMKSIYKDVSNILKQYMSLKEKHGIPRQRIPWEYISLSKNFKDDKTWEYFTGHVVDKIEAIPEMFSSFEIPSRSLYACDNIYSFWIKIRLKLSNSNSYQRSIVI